MKMNVKKDQEKRAGVACTRVRAHMRTTPSHKSVSGGKDRNLVVAQLPTHLAKLEDQVRGQNKRRRVEVAILGTVALSGFMTLALMAPNAVRVLQHVVPDMRPTSQRQSVKRAISRLIRQGYIARKKGDRGYSLTSKGILALMRATRTASAPVRTMAKRTGRTWDGKWRVVSFDIRERDRMVRNELRGLLKEVGFTKLQDSVWVYPFRCDEVIALLKIHLSLGYKLVYIIAEAIEDDGWLRSLYGLPST
jgi:hypothetical protein